MTMEDIAGQPGIEAENHHITAAERRRHPRTFSRTTCLVKTRDGVHEYVVRNLSVSGALLTAGPKLGEGYPLTIVLRIPLYPEVSVAARVVRNGVDDDDLPYMGVEFVHKSDQTEDHIQAALLSELERSRSDGKIADILD
jgi:hypothetical protein